MARPCKDDANQDARQKLYDAFWMLLETHDLRDISVSMVVDQARCNRGTFYYHYRDMEHLISSAIERDLGAGRRAVAETLLGIATNNADWFERNDPTAQFAHVCLIMNKGGMKYVDENVKKNVMGIWRAILCPNGETLATESEMILHFYANGILGVLSSLSTHHPDIEAKSLCAFPYFQQASQLLLTQLAQAQNVPVEVITARLATAARLSQLN